LQFTATAGDCVAGVVLADRAGVDWSGLKLEEELYCAAAAVLEGASDGPCLDVIRALLFLDLVLKAGGDEFNSEVKTSASMDGRRGEDL
jgi:hypothetical protein